MVAAGGSAFCEECYRKVHGHARRRDHGEPRRLDPPPRSYLESRSPSEPAPRLNMELFAVVCIETSHYVTFVKAGLGDRAPWCFFDSMADRKGTQSH
jgi:ubiquitin thioesterase CYLD